MLPDEPGWDWDFRGDADGSLGEPPLPKRESRLDPSRFMGDFARLLVDLELAGGSTRLEDASEEVGAVLSAGGGGASSPAFVVDAGLHDFEAEGACVSSSRSLLSSVVFLAAVSFSVGERSSLPSSSDMI